MSQLDDFGVDNPNEDRIDGAEDYITEVWDANTGIDDPSLDDDDTVEAETIVSEPSVTELAKGNKEIEEPPEAELSS